MKTLLERKCKHCECSISDMRPNALMCKGRECKIKDRRIRNEVINGKRPTVNPKPKPKPKLKYKTKDEPNEALFMEFLTTAERNLVLTRRDSFKYAGMTEEEIQASYLEDLY